MMPLSPAMLDRIAGQGRATRQAAGTIRTLAALQPRFGRPSAISYDRGATWLPITYGKPGPDPFALHPALDPATSIGARP